MASPSSIAQFAESLFTPGAPTPDVIVNASGLDERKDLSTHTADDVQRLVRVNLEGPVLLTREVLALEREFKGVIAHLGGFAGGRLAMPFYSVDVGTRAGLRSFLEAVNRELDLEGRPASALFFSPDPAETEAEKPFLELWRQLGSSVVDPSHVARELLRAIAARRRVHIMGGVSASVLASLNDLCPGAADALLLKSWGHKLKAFLQKQ